MLAALLAGCGGARVAITPFAEETLSPEPIVKATAIASAAIPRERAMEIAVENAGTLLDGPFSAHLKGVTVRDAFLVASLFRVEEGLPYPDTLFFDDGYPDYYVVVLIQREEISALATVTTEGEFWSLAPVGGEFSEEAERYPHVSEQEAREMAQAYAQEQGPRVRGPFLAFAGGPFGDEFLPVWWFALEGEETLMTVFVDQQGHLLTGMSREQLGWFMFKPHMTPEEAVEAAGYWLALTNRFYPSPILEAVLTSEVGEAEWVESQGENVDRYRIPFGEYVVEIDDAPSDGLFAVRRK